MFFYSFFESVVVNLAKLTHFSHISLRFNYFYTIPEGASGAYNRKKQTRNESAFLWVPKGIRTLDLRNHNPTF